MFEKLFEVSLLGYLSIFEDNYSVGTRESTNANDTRFGRTYTSADAIVYKKKQENDEIANDHVYETHR